VCFSTPRAGSKRTRTSQTARDWGNLPIRKLDGTFYNEAAKALYEEFGNELVEKTTDTYVMVLKTFKTAKKFGQQEFELPKRLSHYIQRSIKLVSRAYFVTLLSDLGQPMGDNYWTQYIREIPFSKGRHLTTNHLRHVFVTDRYNKDASLSGSTVRCWPNVAQRLDTDVKL
jgi:hypothetical protein